MNDETTGQLTSEWIIPEYAQPHLWVDSEASSAPAEGPYGAFALDAPASVVTVRWGANDGTPLTQLRWRPDTLAWDGRVRLAGMVESIHIQQFLGIEEPISVVSISAQALLPHVQAYPDASLREVSRFALPDFHDGIADDDEPLLVPLLVGTESPLERIAHEAMAHNFLLYCFGRLADEDAGWHQLFALPILWEGVTIFVP